MYDYPGRKISQKVQREVQKTEIISTGKIVILLGIFFLIAMFFVQQRIEFIQVEKRIRELMREQQSLKTSIIPLKLEERYLSQLEIIEKIARNQLKLKDPRPDQIKKIVIRSSK